MRRAAERASLTRSSTWSSRSACGRGMIEVRAKVGLELGLGLGLELGLGLQLGLGLGLELG